MSESFSVGDLVEVISSKPGAPVSVGMRGVVIEPHCVQELTGVVYAHVNYSGQLVYSLPECIRKIQPPPIREQVSTWDDVIVWKPREVSHV